MTLPTPLRTALLGIATALVVAAPAAADSIAYIKDGNVWLGSPDGSRQQQVTTTGGYSWVSQADDGTMAALAPKEHIHKLSRTGEVLADIATYVSDGAPAPAGTTQFHGPFEPEISPDGTKIAYEWFNQMYNNGGHDCNESTIPPCQVLTSRTGVGITHSDRFTGPEEFGFLTGWLGPRWLSNDKLLRSDVYANLNEDAVFNEIGPGKGDDVLDRWLYDPGAAGLREVVLSPDHNAAAGIAGDADQQLRVYHPNVDPFNAPDWDFSFFSPKPNKMVADPCFAANGPTGGKFESMSFSPDGRHLAYSVADGVWVVSIPDFSGGCSVPAENALKLPDGHHPHWGRADIPPASAYERKGAGQPAGGTPNSGGGGPSQGEAGASGGSTTALAFAAARAKLAKALRSGLRVTVQAPGAGTLSVQALKGRKVVAKGSARALGAGKVPVTVRFTKAGRKALKKARSAKLTLKATYTPRSGAAAKASSVVTLKR